MVEGEAGEPQDHTAASYAGFMEEEFSHIRWSNDSRTIHHQVRTHRFMRSAGRPIAEVDRVRLHVRSTSLEPAEGIRVERGDGRPLWITESATLPSTKEPQHLISSAGRKRCRCDPRVLLRDDLVPVVKFGAEYDHRYKITGTGPSRQLS